MEQLSIFSYEPVTPIQNIIQFPKQNTHTPRSATVKNQTACVIKDADVLASIKEKLSSTGKYGKRNFSIFLFALNTGLRMGDVLTLRMSDIYDFEAKKVKTKIHIFEEKTDKRKTLYLNSALEDALNSYVREKGSFEPSSPLFPSRKKGSHTKERDKDDTGCLNVKSYWEILHGIAKELGVEHLSCHSTRKTYAWTVYQHYKGQLVDGQFSALDIVQKQLNHSSSNVTLRYIGIDDDVSEAIARDISL